MGFPEDEVKLQCPLSEGFDDCITERCAWWCRYALKKTGEPWTGACVLVALNFTIKGIQRFGLGTDQGRGKGGF